MAQRSTISTVAPRRVTAQPVALDVLSGVEIRRENQPAAAVRPPSAPAAQPSVRAPEPLYVLNSSVIISGNALNSINPKDIKAIKIYKSAPEAPGRWRSLTAHGIVDLTAPAKVKSKTFAQLGRWLQLTGPVSYWVNGMPIVESNLRIATDAIAEIQVSRDAISLGAVVNVHTVVWKPKPSTNPPGTIMIRGTASR